MERLTERKWTSKDNTQPTVVLETCANCGGEAKNVIHAKTYTVFIQCGTCGMQTPKFELYSQAVAIWNKRVNKQQHV